MPRLDLEPADRHIMERLAPDPGAPEGAVTVAWLWYCRPLAPRKDVPETMTVPSLAGRLTARTQGWAWLR